MKTIRLITALALTIGVWQAQANNTTHSLFGIDVSHYQGQVTWSSVYSDGVRFAFAKASEGTSYTDPDFAGNISRGKNQSLQMGAYHFSNCSLNCVSPEANHFWAVAGGTIVSDGKSLYPTLDLEDFNGHACQPSYTDWANTWSDDVKAKTSTFLRPVIYISACNACLLNTSITMSAWIAHYNGQNLYTGNPWSSCASCNVWGNNNSWTYWQATSTGSVSGISGNVDEDAYNGTLAELKSWQGV